MLTIRNNYSKFSIAAIGIISLLLIYFFVWRTDAVGYGSVIGGDGNDYYSYLMSIFIDKNLGHQDTSPWYVIQTPTGTVNVHMIGVSLLLLPFFLVGYLWAVMGGYAVNGISEPFQKMISLGALFYLIVGLYFIRKLLIDLKNSDKSIAAILALIFFGTNLLNYSVNEPSMSHVYSFSLMSAFLYYSRKMMLSKNAKYFAYAGIIMGLIFLVRPINVIILMILPFWLSSFAEFKSVTKQLHQTSKTNISIAIISCLTVLSVQSIIWYFQNGKFVQWTYKDNGLYLFSPNTFKMLFGFNAGFFIYTPLCLFLLLGFIPMYKEHKYKFSVLALFIIFIFYLLSCHWAYTYFDGLSIRALVDFYPVFAIVGVKLFSGKVIGYAKSLSLSAISASVLLNLIFCFQYKAGILPPAGMNKEKFTYIFLKTDRKYAGVLGGCNDLLPYSKNHPEASYVFENNFNEIEFFNYKEKEYGVAYEIPQLGFATSKIYVKVELKRKEAEFNSSCNALLVLDIQSPDKKTKNFQAYKLNDVPSENCCEWKTWNYNVTMDGKINATDKLVVYIWNKEKKEFFIDDFKVKVYNYNYNA